MMNAFFIVKIAAIIANFKPVPYENLIYLKNLISRSHSSSLLPFFSMSKVATIMLQAKSSFSLGFNNTNMKIIKLNPKVFAPHITIAIKDQFRWGIP